MPERPPRAKRAVSAARVVAAEAPRAAAARVRAPVIKEDVDNDRPANNYALRLTQALDAISSAEGIQPLPLGEAARSAGEGRARGGVALRSRRQPSPPPSPRGRGSVGFARLREAFRNLPPIRLPIGPPIPWRLGLPALLVLVVLAVFFARPAARADSQVSRLPAAEAYPVEQQAPLFIDAQPTSAAPAPSQSLGVPDAGGPGFDVLDVGIKLIAVLALAYGSLLLLKRTGMGGAAAVKAGGKAVGMQVVSSLTLAPNRTVHLLKVPGGKTLLVGATPNQVNLIADLGEISEDLESDTAASFFDVLKGKISQ